VRLCFACLSVCVGVCIRGTLTSSSLQAVFDTLRPRVPEVQLDVYEGNDRSVRFHENMGV
jgi:hypothetical protein